MEDGLAFCRQDFIQLFYTVSELPPAPPQKKKNKSKTMTPPLPAVSLNWIGYQYVYNYLASFVKINELEKKGVAHPIMCLAMGQHVSFLRTAHNVNTPQQ